MVTGEPGQHGVLAARPVEVAPKPEVVSATIQPQPMEELLVQAAHLHLNHATH